MARAPARRLVLAMAVASGCTDAAPEPVLLQVEPAQAYTDRPQRLILRGHGFLPSFRVDPGAGRRQSDASGFWGFVGLGPTSVRLVDFSWRSSDELSATLEAGLPPGAHAVTVVDPRGKRALTSGGFSALGNDHEAPRVTFDSPEQEALIAPGTRVKVRLRASDQPGHLREVRWEALGPADVLLANTCAVPPQAPAITCAFDVVVPSTLRAGDSFELTAYASDDAPHENGSRVMRSFRLQPPAVVGQVKPASGGMAGGTEVLVTGTGFLPGSRVMIGGVPLAPDGGVRVNEHTFTGRTPAHAAGVAQVTVETPVGVATVAAAFEYLPPPKPTSVVPAEDAAEGGAEVHVMGESFTCNTRIYLGTKLSTATPLWQRADSPPCLSPPAEIVGMAPAGQGRATVWAFDPATGWGSLPGAFTWRSAPDAAAPPDASPDLAEEDTAPP